MAALDQLNGGLTLADAGITEDQDALAVDLHQYTVAGDAGCQLGVQRRDELAHQAEVISVDIRIGTPYFLPYCIISDSGCMPRLSTTAGGWKEKSFSR